MSVVIKTALFRCDASVQIGSGHVMRCLTLADMIAQSGGTCHFVCRVLPGDLITHITNRGHKVHPLPAPVDPVGWLGVPLDQEIAQAGPIIATLAPDRIIVDHYGLDAAWETAVAPAGCPVMVIDDVADRSHACDILLDQNLGRKALDYGGLVPDNCTRLIGTDYALLRPEFAAARPASLVRRKTATLRHIMISMGGADADNVTTDVLDALAHCDGLPADVHITVVMGSSAPHLDVVRARAGTMPIPTNVRVNVPDMAALMVQSDLAIGAAGSTSWERCCLGLPTLMLVLADNQASAAKALGASSGAVIVPGLQSSAAHVQFCNHLMQCNHPDTLRKMAVDAAQIVDGVGTTRVLASMTKAVYE